MLMFDMLSVMCGRRCRIAALSMAGISRVTTQTNFEFGIFSFEPDECKEENLKIFQKGCQLNPDLDISAEFWR